MKTLAGGGELRCIPYIEMSKTLIYCIQTKNSQCKKMLKKKSQKTVEIESRNVVETDTTSLCLLKKPTYRQHFRGRRSFNYAKRFSVFNQEIWQCNPHSNRPLWALRPPFYLASSLHPPHEPSPQLLIGWRPKNLSLKSMKKLCDLVSNRIENCVICFQIA